MADAVRLEHVGIPASEQDFDEVVAFYRDNFGWQVIRELQGAQRIAFISDGSGGTIEVLVADGGPLTQPSHLAFAVPMSEYEDLKSRLTGSGVNIDVETENAAGDKLAFFNDPHGNRAQIVGRINPLQ